MKNNSTPPPWWFDGREIMTVPRGDIKICRVYPVTQDDDGRANASMIVTAVNNFRDMCAALVWMENELNAMNEAHGQDERINTQLGMVRALITKLQ